MNNDEKLLEKVLSKHGLTPSMIKDFHVSDSADRLLAGFWLDIIEEE